MGLLRHDRTRPSLSKRTMLWIHSWLSPIVKRPGVTMTTGFLLLIIGIAEAVEVIFPQTETALHSAHGVALFGIITMMRGFVEMVEGLEIMGLDAEIRQQGSSD